MEGLGSQSHYLLPARSPAALSETSNGTGWCQLCPHGHISLLPLPLAALPHYTEKEWGGLMP